MISLDDNIEIRVLQARDLPKADTFGKIDPYFVLIVGSETQRTVIMKNTYNPVYSETFFFSKDLSTEVDILVKLFDWDLGSKDEYIGCLRIPVTEEFVNRRVRMWCLLTDTKERSVGEVELEIVLNKPIGYPANPPTTSQEYPPPSSQECQHPAPQGNPPPPSEVHQFSTPQKHQNVSFPCMPGDISLPLRFVPVTNPGFKGCTIKKNKVTWKKSDAYPRFFVEPELTDGIHKLVIECSGKMKYAFFSFGLTNQDMGHFNLENACYIGQRRICSGGDDCVNSEFFSDGCRVTLALELNANTRTLYFFVNGKQIPYSIVNTPSAAYFGVNDIDSYGTVVELKSLTRLAMPSVSPSLACARFEFK